MGRKTAIITGANRGVGRGVANVFAEKGYDLFLAYNGETEKAKEVQQYVTEKYGVRCELFDCDLSKVRIFISWLIQQLAFMEKLMYL